MQSSTLLLALGLACLASFAAGACTPIEGQIEVPGATVAATVQAEGSRMYKCKDGKPDGPSTTGSFATFTGPTLKGKFNYSDDAIAQFFVTDAKTKMER